MHGVQREETYTVGEIAGFLKFWGFNAVRLPVSLPLALNLMGKGDPYHARNDRDSIADVGENRT
jgi:hypothetical protein